MSEGLACAPYSGLSHRSGSCAGACRGFWTAESLPPAWGRSQSKSSACLCPAAGDYALPMFDLGRTFLAVVERNPDATAITDGERRLGYMSWYQEIGRVAAGLTALGLEHGDRL